MSDIRIEWVREHVCPALHITADQFNGPEVVLNPLLALLDSKQRGGVLFYIDEILQEVEVEGSKPCHFHRTTSYMFGSNLMYIRSRSWVPVDSPDTVPSTPTASSPTVDATGQPLTEDSRSSVTQEASADAPASAITTQTEVAVVPVPSADDIQASGDADANAHVASEPMVDPPVIQPSKKVRYSHWVPLSRRTVVEQK
jgi:hypothetical protein